MLFGVHIYPVWVCVLSNDCTNRHKIRSAYFTMFEAVLLQHLHTWLVYLPMHFSAQFNPIVHLGHIRMCASAIAAMKFSLVYQNFHLLTKCWPSIHRSQKKRYNFIMFSGGYSVGQHKVHKSAQNCCEAVYTLTCQMLMRQEKSPARNTRIASRLSDGTKRNLTASASLLIHNQH